MKKNLLALIFMALTAYASAQICVPDTHTVPGIYPDSATNLPPACIGELYNVIVTAVVPHDTSAQTPFGAATVTIDSINVKNWDNPTDLALPPNFNVACEPPGCSFPGGPAPGQVSKGCLKITGFLQASDVTVGDSAVLHVDLKVFLSNVPIVGNYQLDNGSEDVDYYYIKYKAQGTCVTGIQPAGERAFSVNQNSPNPFKKNTTINFTNNKTGEVVFTVYNMIGEVVHTQKVYSAEDAQNVIWFDGNNLPSGIYSYSLNNGERTISKRMILLEN